MYVHMGNSGSVSEDAARIMPDQPSGDTGDWVSATTEHPPNVHPRHRKATSLTALALCFLHYQSHEIDRIATPAERHHIVSAEQIVARIRSGPDDTIAIIGEYTWKELKQLLDMLRDEVVSVDARPPTGRGASLSIARSHPAQWACGKKHLINAINYYNDCVQKQIPMYEDSSSDGLDALF